MTDALHALRRIDCFPGAAPEQAQAWLDTLRQALDSRFSRGEQWTGRSNALFRSAGAGAEAAMGWPAPLVEAVNEVFVVDGDRPSAVDPGRKRMFAAASGRQRGQVGGTEQQADVRGIDWRRLDPQHHLIRRGLGRGDTLQREFEFTVRFDERAELKRACENGCVQGGLGGLADSPAEP